VTPEESRKSVMSDVPVELLKNLRFISTVFVEVGSDPDTRVGIVKEVDDKKLAGGVVE
jgi:hypothetical protein